MKELLLEVAAGGEKVAVVSGAAASADADTSVVLKDIVVRIWLSETTN